MHTSRLHSSIDRERITSTASLRWGDPASDFVARDVGRLDLVRTAPHVAESLSSGGARMSLDDYLPRLPHGVWDEIGPFVRDATLTAAPLTPYTAHRVAVVLTRYVFWARRNQGLPLDARLLFRREVIHRYIERERKTGKLAEGTLRNYRSMLKRVSLILLPEANEPAAAPLNTRTTIQPYSEAEVQAIVWWTRGQNTDERTHKATAMAALCLGAGLRSLEVAELRRRDVQVDGAGIVLGVNGREVPLLSEWEPPLRRIVAPLAADDYVFGARTRKTTRNLLSAFVERSAGDMHPRSDRMRATWLVTHLAAGTNIGALVRAAGIRKFENLARYLEFVPELDTAEYRRQLRAAVR